MFLKKFIFTLANAVKDLVGRNLYQSLNYIGHFLVKDIGPPPSTLKLSKIRRETCDTSFEPA